jgi:hypothetical protein
VAEEDREFLVKEKERVKFARKKLKLEKKLEKEHKL